MGNGKTVTKQVSEKFTVPSIDDKIIFKFEEDDVIYMAKIKGRIINCEQPSLIVLNVDKWEKV